MLPIKKCCPLKSVAPSRLLAKDSESGKPLLAAAVAADPIADWREYGEPASLYLYLHHPPYSLYLYLCHPSCSCICICAILIVFALVFAPSSLYLYLNLCLHPCICAILLIVVFVFVSSFFVPFIRIWICAFILVFVFVFAPSSSYLYLSHNPCMCNSTWLWCWCWRWVTHCLLYLVVFVFARDPIADWREYCALYYTLTTLKKSTSWKNPSSSP